MINNLQFIILAPFDIKIGVKCAGTNNPVIANPLHPIMDLDTAKDLCYKDPNCAMFYSDCGSKSRFRKCTSNLEIVKSSTSCNTQTNPDWEGKDILYIKGN